MNVTSVFTVTVNETDVTVSCNRCRERMGCHLDAPQAPCVHEAIVTLCVHMHAHWRVEHAGD